MFLLVPGGVLEHCIKNPIYIFFIKAPAYGFVYKLLYIDFSKNSYKQTLIKTPMGAVPCRAIQVLVYLLAHVLVCIAKCHLSMKLTGTVKEQSCKSVRCTCLHPCIHTHTTIHQSKHMHACVHVCVCACVSACMHARIIYEFIYKLLYI